MLKQLLCLAAALSAAAGITSYAADETVSASAEYNDSSGKVEVSGLGDNIRTVLITDTESAEGLSGDNIYYIAQGSALSASAGFAMKKDPEPGTYYLVYSAADTEEYASVIPFRIGVEVPDTWALTALDGAVSRNEDGTFNKGFVTYGVALSAYKSLIFTFEQDSQITTMGYSMDDLSPVISGAGSVNLGIQLDNIPDEYSNAQITMYLSIEALPDTGLETETNTDVTEE